MELSYVISLGLTRSLWQRESFAARAPSSLNDPGLLGSGALGAARISKGDHRKGAASSAEPGAVVLFT